MTDSHQTSRNPRIVHAPERPIVILEDVIDSEYAALGQNVEYLSILLAIREHGVDDAIDHDVDVVAAIAALEKHLGRLEEVLLRLVVEVFQDVLVSVF